MGSNPQHADTVTSIGQSLTYISGPSLLMLTPATPKGREYIELPPNELKKVFVNTSLVFQVKTCNNANVNYGEYEESENDQQFEDKISIGGGNNTFWKISGCSLKSEKDIVSCTEFRSFWIWFNNNTIALGKGETVGEREVISCRQKEIKLIHLRLSTFVSKKGIWLLNIREG